MIDQICCYFLFTWLKKIKNRIKKESTSSWNAGGFFNQADCTVYAGNTVYTTLWETLFPIINIHHTVKYERPCSRYQHAGRQKLPSTSLALWETLLPIMVKDIELKKETPETSQLVCVCVCLSPLISRQSLVPMTTLECVTPHRTSSWLWWLHSLCVCFSEMSLASVADAAFVISTV